MTIDETTPPESEHLEIRELLPWYVNASLDSLELSRVRRHLEGCSDCRGETAELENISNLFRTPESPPQAMEASLATLRERIAADQDPRPLAVRLRRMRAWFRVAPKSWRVALVAPSALATVLAALLVFGTSPGPVPSGPSNTLPAATEPSFTVLSDPRGEVVRYWVRFEGAATLNEVSELLRSIGATISSGPTSQGIYTVELRRTATGVESPVARLASLQRSDLVATIVEAPPSQGTGRVAPVEP